MRRVRLGDIDGDGACDALTGTIIDELEPDGTYRGELADISQVQRNVGATRSLPPLFEPTLQVMPTGELVDLDQDGIWTCSRSGS